MIKKIEIKTTISIQIITYTSKLKRIALVAILSHTFISFKNDGLSC